MNRVITKWFIRVNLDQSVKYIYTRLKPNVAKNLCPCFDVLDVIKSLFNSRVIINDTNDLNKLDQLIIACFNEVAERLPINK